MRLLDKLYAFLIKRLFYRKPISAGDVYYINGPEILPPPLTQERECEILNSPELTAELKDELIEHNLRLVVYIAKKFENTGVGIEDLISIGTIGLIKSINTYKVDKNIKLATYASRCIENEILMFIRKSSQLRRDVSIDEPLNIDWDGNELLLSDVLSLDGDSVSSKIEKDEDELTIRRAVDDLPEREQTIIKLRYGFGGGKTYTQKEVADMLGISQSYISRLEKKIIDDLKLKMLT